MSTLIERFEAVAEWPAVLDRRHLLVAGAVVLMLGAAPGLEMESTAHGQDRSRWQAGPQGPTQSAPAADPNRSDVDLPEWARPSTRSPERPSNQSRQPGAERQMATRNGFNPPEPNKPVPLGGLEWLLLAGGGYAVWKLRRDEEGSGPFGLA